MRVPDERGQGSVEMLFVIMITAMLLFAGFELGQGVLLKHALDVGTEKAARILSINPADYATAVQTIRTEVDANILGGGYGDQVTVRLYDAATLGEITAAQLAGAPFGYRFLVGAELPWQGQAPFVNFSARTLTAAHQGIVERIP